MEFFDAVNLYLSTHPLMMDQLVYVFRLKFWLLSAIALYVMFLPIRENRNKQKQKPLKKGQFLA